MANDELKDSLYGKTAKVMLADGKEYVFREPTIASLKNLDVELDELTKPKNLSKMVLMMLKADNPELTEDRAGQLVTFSMLKQESPFMKTILNLLGLGKNEQAGEKQ